MLFEEHEVTAEDLEAIDRWWEYLKERERELVGIDYGYEYVRGRPSGEKVLRFIFLRRIAAEELRRTNDAPVGDYRTYGLNIDVLASPQDYSPVPGRHPGRTARRNPIQPGISLSGYTQGAGTLGAIVYRWPEDGPGGGQGAREALLSCYHVLAPPDYKPSGKDDERYRRYDAIFQPSPVDGGEHSFDMVAWLGKTAPKLDAALADLTRLRMVRLHQYGTGVVVNRAARISKLGTLLVKSGRGSGVSCGRVDGIGKYRLRLSGEKSQWIDGFLLLPPDGLASLGPGQELSSQGDSGALWYAPLPTGEAVGYGMHLAGERTENEIEYAVAVHLPDVLYSLKASLTPLSARLDKEINGVLATLDTDPKEDKALVKREVYEKLDSDRVELLALLRKRYPAEEKGKTKEVKAEGSGRAKGETAKPPAISTPAAAKKVEP